MTAITSPRDEQHPWYPVAASERLQAGRSIDAVHAGGAELVIWRAASGQVQAWENRCPHRSVRLSIGQVSGERLACAYHGWQFEVGTGACVVLPAHPALPAPQQIRVKTWRTLEVDGMLWVSEPVDGPTAQVHAGRDQIVSDPRVDAHWGDDSVAPGGHWWFGRSLALRQDFADVCSKLADRGWSGTTPVVSGTHRGHRFRGFMQDARAGLSFAHVWVWWHAANDPGRVQAQPTASHWRDIHSSLRDLRLLIEQQA